MTKSAKGWLLGLTQWCRKGILRLSFFFFLLRLAGSFGLGWAWRSTYAASASTCTRIFSQTAGLGCGSKGLQNTLLFSVAMRRPLLFNPSSRNSGKQGKLDSVNHGPAGFFYMAHVLQLIWVICQAASDWRWFSFREPGDYHCIVCTVLISNWTKLAIETKEKGLCLMEGPWLLKNHRKQWLRWQLEADYDTDKFGFAQQAEISFHQQKHLPIHRKVLGLNGIIKIPSSKLTPLALFLLKISEWFTMSDFELSSDLLNYFQLLETAFYSIG